jgi:hypothetical protein
MNSHIAKQNNCHYIERHTKTGNQEKVSCFFAPIFGIFKNRQYYAVQRGNRKKSPLSFGKSAGCPWRAGEKKFSQIPAYSGLRGVVRNEGEFLQINVHFPFCWFVGIRGRNIAAALAKSPLAVLKVLREAHTEKITTF